MHLYIVFIFFSYVDLSWRFNSDRHQYLVENLKKIRVLKSCRL
jgi:hypothetical protein